MGSIKKKLVKGLRKITPKEIAPALPFLAMAIPGMGFASSALLRYGLPQLLTAAASARQTGDINLLNQALALGASYAAGPGTAGATNKEAAFMNKNVAPGGTTPVGYGAGQVDPGLAQAAGVNTNPALIDSASKLTYTPGMNAQQFAGANPDAFKAFKTANPGVKNTFAQNLNASLRPIGEGIQAMGSGDILDPKALMVVGGGGGTMATADYAKKKEIEFEEEEARKQGYIGDYADAINAYKDYFRNATYDYEDIYGIGRIPSFLAADGGRVKLQEGGDLLTTKPETPFTTPMPNVNMQPIFSLPGNIGNPLPQQNPMAQIQSTVNQAIDNMQGNLNQNLQNSFKTETVDAIVPNDQQASLASSGMMPANRPPSGILGMLGGGGNMQNLMAMRQQFINRLRPQMGYAEGGDVVAPGMPAGMQVDGRNGTFIPMGVKEKADDVPAMLSKNEFVMTADAVKGLGNGSPELGAQRMYDLMNTLEAKV
tara:strand:+ start:3531 stop:4982 length:1452 start_codon:yes stop_codon:yes gene_type:complete